MSTSSPTRTTSVPPPSPSSNNITASTASNIADQHRDSIFLDCIDLDAPAHLLPFMTKQERSDQLRLLHEQREYIHGEIQAVQEEARRLMDRVRQDAAFSEVEKVGLLVRLEMIIGKAVAVRGRSDNVERDMWVDVE